MHPLPKIDGCSCTRCTHSNEGSIVDSCLKIFFVSSPYRIPDYPSGCDAKKPLAQNIKELLQKESNQCLKPTTIPTKVSEFIYLIFFFILILASKLIVIKTSVI